MGDQPVKLTPYAWILEEEKRAEKTLEHMRSVFGSFKCETNPTYAYFEGYLSAIRTIIRKMDE